MSRFTIAIVPDTDAGDDRGAIRGVVRVDSSNDQLLVTQFTLVALNGADLSGQGALLWEMNTLARLLCSVTSVPRPAATMTAATTATIAAGTPETTTPSGAAAHVRADARAEAPDRRRAVDIPDLAGPGNGSRPYRRMPTPEVVMAVYLQSKTIAGVANHFDVPRHTANHWARKLRAMGHQIGRA